VSRIGEALAFLKRAFPFRQAILKGAHPRRLFCVFAGVEASGAKRDDFANALSQCWVSKGAFKCRRVGVRQRHVREKELAGERPLQET